MNQLSCHRMSLVQIMIWKMKGGLKSYELSNHLGNVLAVVSDKVKRTINNTNSEEYASTLLSAQNYYPFGMVMPGIGEEGVVIDYPKSLEVGGSH